MDDFDRVLLKGVEQGFFDEIELKSTANLKSEALDAAKLEGSLFSAWRLYHDSLDDNEAEFVSALETAVKKGAKRINPANLNATIEILKKLGHTDKALAMIPEYVAARSGEKDLFDILNSHFGTDVKTLIYEPRLRANSPDTGYPHTLRCAVQDC
ncbi:MAG: hypothetical protein WDM81_01415 [Rhizomicrobium sp.]